MKIGTREIVVVKSELRISEEAKTVALERRLPDKEKESTDETVVESWLEVTTSEGGDGLK